LPGNRTSSSVSQKLQEREINGRVVLQPNTWYTCPAGKTAKVKGCIQCTGTGAAATADLIAAGIIIFRWLPAGFVESFQNGPRTLSADVDQFAEFDINLSAGETIITDQNTGTNAEFNMFATVTETDV